MSTTPIRAEDLTWLNMDRPNNLTVITGMIWMDEPPDWDAVESTIAERLIARFPVFGQRAVLRDGTWYWEDAPDFDLHRHVRRVTLPEPSDMAAARAHSSAVHSAPLDREHPLWRIDLISRVRGMGPDGGGEGAIMLTRFHHAIADGMRLVQMLLGLCDVGPATIPTANVGRRSTSGTGVTDRVRGIVTGTAGHVADIVGGTARAVGGTTLGVVGQAMTDPLAMPGNVLHDGWDLVSNPSKGIDALAALGSPDNRLINDWASVSKMVLPPKMPATCWTGTPGQAKTLSWISGGDLSAVASASKRAGASINDTMLSLIGAGLHDYLAQHGDTRTEDLLWIIPVTLKPLDPSAPPELGNHVALMSLALPVGIEDPDARVSEIRTRMLRLKHSDEAAILLGLQKVVGVTPPAISSRIVDMVANRHVGVITNVPGPQAPMSLAGTEVAGVMGWNPMSGNQPITICIFSYNGTVSVGFSTDDTLIPDPDALVGAVRAHLVAGGFLEPADD